MKDAYIYSSKALKLGEEVGDQNVIGYACAGLTWTCAHLGLLEKAIIYGKRAQEIWRLYKSNQEFFHFSFAGAAIAYYFRGDTRKTNELGKILLDYGHNLKELCMSENRTNTFALDFGSLTDKMS